MDTGTDNDLDDAIIGNSNATGDDTGKINDTGGLETGDPGNTATIKRGRGRPAGSGSGTKGKVGSGTKSTPGSGKEQPKREAQKAQNAVGRETINTVGLEKILFSIHKMLGAALIPELEIDQPESKELAEAVASVNQFYDKQIDPKVLAWVGLITVAGKIYAPRVGLFVARKALEKPVVRKQQVAPVQSVVSTPQSVQQNGAVPPQVQKVFADPAFTAFGGDA